MVSTALDLALAEVRRLRDALADVAVLSRHAQGHTARSVKTIAFEALASDGGEQLARAVARERGQAFADEVSAARELLCERCGVEHPVWFAPNAVWNAVMRPDPDGPDEYAFVCPTCFVVLAERAEIHPTGWMIAPEGAIETTTTWRMAG